MMTSITGTLHKDQDANLIISRSVLLRTKNGLDKSQRENKEYIFCCKFFPENHAFFR
jgi:hypothetical protein